MGCGGYNPLFSSGSGTFLIEMVLVKSESNESEYVISNVLSNVLVLSFKVTRHVNESTSLPLLHAFVCSRIQIHDISFVLKGETCGHAC